MIVLDLDARRPTVMEGTPGLELEQVSHIFIPGRGRNATGDDLSPEGHQRVEYAYCLYRQRGLAARAGRIVCSGYKTPMDTAGKLWLPPDSTLPDWLPPSVDSRLNEGFQGIPEAYAARRLLRKLGCPAAAIGVEPYSFDTVTNFVYSEAGKYFGEDDGRPVAIVAQRAHLERMVKVVAPRTLRRPFLGVVVPEAVGHEDTDGYLPRLVSRVALLGMSPYRPDIAAITSRRGELIWKVAKPLRELVA